MLRCLSCMLAKCVARLVDRYLYLFLQGTASGTSWRQHTIVARVLMSPESGRPVRLIDDQSTKMVVSRYSSPDEIKGLLAE